MDGEYSPTKEGYADERLIAYTLADCPEYPAWLSDLFAPLKRPPQIAKEHDSATSHELHILAGGIRAENRRSISGCFWLQCSS